MIYIKTNITMGFIYIVIKLKERKMVKNQEMIHVSFALEKLIQILRLSQLAQIPRTWMKMNWKCSLKLELG
jgi:hypothetical protein